MSMQPSHASYMLNWAAAGKPKHCAAEDAAEESRGPLTVLRAVALSHNSKGRRMATGLTASEQRRWMLRMQFQAAEGVCSG